jgi:hypothetical protein
MLKPTLREAIKDWIHIILCIKAKTTFYEWDIGMFPHFGRARVTPFCAEPAAHAGIKLRLCRLVFWRRNFGSLNLDTLSEVFMPPPPRAISRIEPRLFRYNNLPNISSSYIERVALAKKLFECVQNVLGSSLGRDNLYHY